MATQHTPVSLPEQQHLEKEVTYHVAMALGEVEKGYKERIAAFAEELHALNGKIATVKDEISLIEKENEEKERALQQLRNEVDAEIKFLERMTDQLLKKAELLAALRRELADVDETKRRGVIEAKQTVLIELKKEIEESEIALLQKELEAQNLRLELEPSRQHIRTLKLKISELEAQKRFLESAGTHRLTRPALASASSQETANDEEVIDTDTE